jgi:electron transport complex protein RnfG
MNRDKAKLEVLPAFEGEPTLKEQNYQLGDFVVNVTEVSAGGEVVGYAVEAPSITKNGYADRIYLMVGFVEEAEGVRISGVKVLSQKETPGLGAKMAKPGNVLESCVLNKMADELVFEVKKDNEAGSFDAISGATISSRAYANAVETAYAGYLMYKGLLLDDDTKGVDVEQESKADAQMDAPQQDDKSEDNSTNVEVDSEAGVDQDAESVVADENAEINADVQPATDDEPISGDESETSEDSSMEEESNNAIIEDEAELVAQEGDIE